MTPFNSTQKNPYITKQYNTTSHIIQKKKTLQKMNTIQNNTIQLNIINPT